jgi:long-chain fatty acid transport protein
VEEIMIRRILSILSALILILAIVSAAVASNGTQIGTVGAKSTAMGSAFRGLSDDWSAGFFNPAGITQFGKWNIGVSAGLIMPRGSYQAHPYPKYQSEALVTDKVDASAQNFIVPALGIFYKATEKLSVGLSVYAPFGLGTEWDLYKVPAGFGVPGAISKEKESFSDHQVIDIQPTAAFKFSEKLSVGLGVSYITGKMTIDQVLLPLNPLLANLGAINAGLATISAMDPRVPSSLSWSSDFNRLIAEMNLDGSGTAYGANLGFLFKPMEKLSIGVSGRYCTDLKLKGDMKTKVTLPFNAANYQALTTAAADVATLDPASSALLTKAAGAFSGQPYVNQTVKDIEADLPLPWTIGAGIAFKPSCCWTITADASMTNWKAWDKVEIMKDGAAINELELLWKNTLEIGAGVEFLAMQMESKKLFLRLGGYTVDSPVPNTTMTPTLLDPARRYVATAGIGCSMGKVSIDFAFEHVFFGDKDIPASEYNIGAEGYPLNYAGIYKFNANVFTLATTISL